MGLTATPACNLGFLTVLNEPSGYLGGYLVTNQWGRPLEFRLSTTVQPNRVQQILYGDTLVPYVCADLIGKTLVDKTGTVAHFIFTDDPAVLDLRLKLDIPVAWLATGGEPPVKALKVQDNVFCHSAQAADVAAIQAMLQRLGRTIDLREPFERIREAIGEARKMGVTSRG